MPALKLLAVCSYSPAHQVAAREALDAILACAVFEQQLSVLFCGEGVGQLLNTLSDCSGSDKPLSRSLSALPLYDVDTIYVDALSLQERGIDRNQLIDGVTVLPASSVRDLLRDSDRIMSF